jgi:glucose dehydrogenase
MPQLQIVHAVAYALAKQRSCGVERHLRLSRMTSGHDVWDYDLPAQPTLA